MALTSGELVVLGLLAERPRHGYDLDTVIEERGIREWTSVGFSSIYYVLRKLEEQGLVRTKQASNARPKDRRTYTITAAGRRACIADVRGALETVTPWHAPVMLGWANSAMLPREDVVAALRTRHDSLTKRLDTLREVADQVAPPGPVVRGIFRHGLLVLEAEVQWVREQLDELDPSDQNGGRKGGRAGTERRR